MPESKASMTSPPGKGRSSQVLRRNRHKFHKFCGPSLCFLAILTEGKHSNRANIVSIPCSSFQILGPKRPSTGTHLALVPAVTMPAYSASKAALNTFIMCLREQLKTSGSNVNVVELWPPPVQSESTVQFTRNGTDRF